MKKIIILFIMTFLAALMLPTAAMAAVSEPYDWGNLPCGGNGFITGIIFHPKEKDLVYIRTDVGGCYRWDKDTSSWTQLMDGFGYEDRNLYGIEGMAVDPNDPDTVYVAAGAWTWDPGDVLKSNDRGKTWEKTGLNQPFYGNGPLRGSGESIAVDPNNSSIIYAGTPQKGLFRSTDRTLSWKSVDGVEYGKNAIRCIVFDPTSKKDGKSQIIYVAVQNKGIYRTSDGGSTWELMQEAVKNPQRMTVGCKGTLFAAAENGLWRYRDGKWTEISSGEQKGKRQNGVDVDPENEDIIYIIGYSSDTMKLPVMMTEDGGKTWINKRDTMDYSGSLEWDKSDPFAANAHDIKIDPFNKKSIWVSDWFYVYTTDDITATPKQHWINRVSGIEETVPRDAVCPDKGKYKVITGVSDVDGFVYEDITKYPQRQIRLERDMPWMMSTVQLDFCEEDQNIIFRCGVDWNVNGKMEYSVDGSETWNNVTNIPYYYDAAGKKLNAVPFGRLAVSAQKNPDTGKPVVVAIPAYNPKADRKLAEGTNTLPLISFDMGETFKEVSGLPQGTNVMDDYWDFYTPLASDRVNGSKFYLYTNNHVYVSTDWGLTWTQTAKLDADPNKITVRAVPYLENNVWVGLGTGGLCCSDDGGNTFRYFDSVTNCIAFGFGKAADGMTCPAAYVYGEIDGGIGLYRSDDMGGSWVKISDKEHQLGLAQTMVVGDRKEFGVVYVSSGGRGFYLGRPRGSAVKETVKPEQKLTIYCNGVNSKTADSAVLSEGTVMVSARELLEGCGFTVDWNDDDGSVTAYRKTADVSAEAGKYAVGVAEEKLKFSPGAGEVERNGETKTLNDPPVWVDGRIFVPLEEFAELIGAEIKKDESGQIIRLYDNVYVM